MNKKGFTLVELLAAITLLGILMMVAIPAFSDMIRRNRNKIYLTDAQKLVALAEYNIRAKSSQIQLPSRGYGIVLTLGYLDNGSLSNPPNDGVYDPNYSFVLAKNTANGLEYSVMLVEKLKGNSYMGIDLHKRESLINVKPTSVVQNFKTSTLTGLTSASGYYNYIKTKLGNSYITSVQYLKKS